MTTMTRLFDTLPCRTGLAAAALALALTVAPALAQPAPPPHGLLDRLKARWKALTK